MKKIFSILMLITVLLVGGMTSEAKTSKSSKKSSSSASVTFTTMPDGYPNIGGHTYSGNLEGVKFKVYFEPLSGPSGVVDVKVSYKGNWEEEINNWYYEGDGEIMFYLDGGTPCYFQIRNGGKELYNEMANFTLKVIK